MSQCITEICHLSVSALQRSNPRTIEVHRKHSLREGAWGEIIVDPEVTPIIPLWRKVLKLGDTIWNYTSENQTQKPNAEDDVTALPLASRCFLLCYK
mmetsp:Transcript_36738/g.89140  ORF Transcript_36738/g.89140 Transcript_36738/m.89140 type:complete len:97 (+) Transcript_36738:1731-2021(+)